MSIAEYKDVNIKDSEINKWLKKHKLKKTQINITKATSALRAEKQQDSLPAGRDVSYTGSDVPRQVIYGEVKVGGTIVFLDSRGNNQNIDIVIAVATHEINAITHLYMDDCEVRFQSGTDGWSSVLWKPDGTIIDITNKIFMRVATGSDSQSAISDLITANPTKWTSEHRLRGVAHVYISMVWDAFLFGDGIPDISFRVEGKKVYDPRTATYRYAPNPALCIADYLTSTRYGVGVNYAARIDEDSSAGGLIDAADCCDEAVPLQAGGTEWRYSCNCYFNTDEAHGTVLERMAAAMGGHITYSNGKWKFWPGKWREPVLTLTEDDLRSSVRFQVMAPRDDIFNAVRGTFASAAKDYIETDYPVVKNSYYASLDGEEIFENIDFHFVTSPTTCQRLAKLELERIRQGIQVEVEVSPKAFQAQVPETIAITLDRYGWDAKTFEVTKADFILKQSAEAQEIVVSLSLRETAEGVFEWNYWEETIADVAPNTNLPSPFNVPDVVGLALASGTDVLYQRGDGTIVPRIRVTWNAFNDFFLTSGGRVEIQYRLTGDSDWQEEIPIPASSTSTYIVDVQDGTYYDVRVRAVNTFGRPSNWSTIEMYFVVGKTEPPNNVSGFAAAVNEYGIQLVWTAVSDLDIAFYEIWKGSAFGTGTLIGQERTTRRVLPLFETGTHTFYIKAVDTSGNYSVSASTVSVIITPPTLSAAAAAFEGPNLILSWAQASMGTWAINDYLIYYGDEFETATFLVSLKGTSYSQIVSYGGARTFWIQPRDAYGNLGDAVPVDTNVISPFVIQNLRPEVIDNNVLLRWTAPAASTLPIAKYVVKKGDEYASAEEIGEKTATFFAIFELLANRYTYWIEAVDTAGNHGLPLGITVSVNEPPDFQLISSVELTNGDVLTNVLERNGRIIGPVNTVRTFENHFSIHGWSTPDDQVMAGYPIYVQPTKTYGRWQKTHDLGTTLTNVLIHLDFTRTDIADSVVLTYKIAYSADELSWTEVENVSAVLADVVRYIRIRLDFGTVP